jgi:hypothetical protein
MEMIFPLQQLCVYKSSIWQIPKQRKRFYLNQLSDGSWESSAMFRLPKPNITNPNDYPCHNFPDDRRLFTTATVLTALSIMRKHLHQKSELLRKNLLLQQRYSCK